MPNNIEILNVLRKHRVPFVVIGGHAVNYHGFQRITEDTDVVWKRSPENATLLFQSLQEMNAVYFGREIDPSTGLEKSQPISRAFIEASHLMMLWTTFGFLDLFDYIPGLPHENPDALFASSLELDGIRYASLDWLRKMKRASGRDKDLLDLQNLPE